MPPLLDYDDYNLIGDAIGDFCLGFYAAIFALFIQIKRARRSPLGLVGYAIVALFGVTATSLTLDTVYILHKKTSTSGTAPWAETTNAIASALSITVDFVAQAILIYRCWHVWDRALWVAIPPTTMSMLSWACGLVVTTSLRNDTKGWRKPFGTISLGLSLVVNTIVSGLMIARIRHVYRRTTELVGVIPNSRPGPLGFVLSALLESAVAVFIAQLAYVVVFYIAHPSFPLMVGPVTSIYGLNCTAIMVRVTMSQSNEATGSGMAQSFMRFAPRISNKDATSHAERGVRSQETQLDSSIDVSAVS